MGWTKSNIRMFMALLITLGFFGIVGSLIFIEVPTESSDILKVLVGFICGAFVIMVSFYFGASEGN